MSVESLFTDNDRADFLRFEHSSILEQFLHLSDSEAALVASYAEQIRPQVGPEKIFPATAFASEIGSVHTGAIFENRKAESIFWAEQAEKLQRAWGEKLAPVAIVAWCHELYDISNSRSRFTVTPKVYTGFQTATFGARQAYANWDQVLNDDTVPDGLQAIELPFEEMHLLLLPGFIFDETSFAQTSVLPVEIPLSRIEKIFYLDPNHPGDRV